MEQLKTTYNEYKLYQAGLPGFPRNFTRDGIITGLIAQEPEVLRHQLLFSGSLQGTKADAFTGEEPGKIFHEYDLTTGTGFIYMGMNTMFNACDTTALFLIGHEQLAQMTGDSSLQELHKERIIAATEYIKAHLIDGIFYENPAHSGAERFALKVTYWKDSEIARRENGVPLYPVAYFLAHVMNLAGMRAAARMLQSQSLQHIANHMKDQLRHFYNSESKSFYIAIDGHGPIEGTNSDILHALYYLEQDDLTGEQLAAIQARASELETPIGYLTLAPMMQDTVEDQYHSSTVWPFEQAIINLGARKFGLDNIAEVSSRVAQHLDTAPEIFVLDDGKFRKGGCDPQLWTIAAKKHFSEMHLLMN